MDFALADALEHHRRGRFAESEAACRRLLSQRPADADALQLLGVLALHAGRLDEAVDSLRRALAARPAWAEAYNNLGVALEARGQWLKAEHSFRAAARLEPGYSQPYINLGNVLRRQGRPAEAAEAYRSASRLRPADPFPYRGLGAVCLEMGRVRDGLANYQRASDLQPQSPSAHSDLLFWMLHDPDVTPRALFEEHLRWSELHERPLRSSADGQFDNDPDPSRPLRVGYVSPDFREHPVARFIEPALSAHDPAHVLPVCYSDVARADEVTARLRAAVAEWRETSGMPDEQVAALIRRDRIDILVDLTGHMGDNRLTVFARRPAPVQATYMGYPYSTGMSTMDWRITDEASDPTGATEQFHTERLIRLEGCAFCYRPTDSPHLTDLPACAAGAVTFAVFNRMAKVNAHAASTWARVLAAVPDSRLMVLVPGGEGNATARRLFESCGVPGRRLRLVPTGPRADYLALAREADILLDTFPYGGMTTTCDFLWMGLPTVTLAGALPPWRAGVSLLAAVGLPHLIATTAEQYVQIAVRLAQDLPNLRSLRAGLRERMGDSDLRNEARFVGKLESAYREMWRAWAHTTVRTPTV